MLLLKAKLTDLSRLAQRCTKSELRKMGNELHTKVSTQPQQAADVFFLP